MARLISNFIAPSSQPLLIGGLLAAASLAVFGCQSGSGPRSHATPKVPATYASLASDAGMQELLRGEATSYLLEMAEHPYAGFRANAIEALGAEQDLGESVARVGLLDVNPGVRFAAAMVIGINKYRDSVPLVHALLQDENASVRVAAIFATARNGSPHEISNLADFLFDDDLASRSNAALALGELGNESAKELLREALEYENPRATVTQERLGDLQIAEAMVKLGDDSALSRIRAHLRSGPDEGEVTALAATMLGNLNAQVYKRDLMNIVAAWKEFQYSAEIRLAAMGSLAQMGEEVPISLVLEYFGSTYQDSQSGEFVAIRSQATFVLGVIGSSESIPHLADLFHDSLDSPVRLQAAAALLKIIKPVNTSTQS